MGSKVLLIGACPLPYENCTRLSAHGSRAWQFAKPLIAAGHTVEAIALVDAGAYPSDPPNRSVRHEQGLTLHALTVTEFEKISVLQKIHDTFKPDCLVTAASFLPSYFAAQIVTEAPLWIDQNGDLMAEAQMLAAARNDNNPLTHYATALAQILARGDRFSAQSARQRYALIGQLAARGRLCKETVGYNFVEVIPDAFDGTPTPGAPVIRGVLCDRNAFVLLWSGGFNTWTDIDTLFAALEAAMKADPSIHFVATGGALPGLEENTYSRFQKMTADSPFADHYHLVGWVPKSDVDGYVAEADLGINIDRDCYETELGSRTRLLGWWAAGLPVLTSNGCELTEQASQANAVATFPQGDANQLAKALLEIVADSDRRKLLADRARELWAERFTFEATTGPLLSWVAAPTHAPDWGVERAADSLNAAVLSEMERKVSHYREKLDDIQRSRSWQLVSKLHTLTRWLGL